MTFTTLNPVTALLLPSKHPPNSLRPTPLLRLPFSSLTVARRRPILAAPADNSAASSAEVDMVRGRDGVWSASEQKVVVLWDLDNKPPRGPPYEAALALRRVAELCGRVVDISAYANRHAFVHLPQWVVEQRRERRRLDILERKGLAPVLAAAADNNPYVCGVCGRKCRTNLDLKKHFRQLHERERQKKLNRMRSLKGKKRQRYRERFISGNLKYEEAARSLLTPKIGYGLAPELRRAGVFVKMVEDKPQAADSALKRQMQHSMTRRIDWLFLVSDDSDFTDMIRRAREAGLRTVVVGDGHRSLGRHADLWVPWMGVENGEVGEEELQSGREAEFHWTESDENDEGSFSSSSFYEDSSPPGYLDDFVDEIVVRSSGRGGVRISAFSEEEVLERGSVGKDIGDSILEILESSGHGDELFSSSEEEDDDYYI